MAAQSSSADLENKPYSELGSKCNRQAVRILFFNLVLNLAGKGKRSISRLA